ncbi:TIGR04141 family sporadically distributed protein [Chryseobacterium sp. KACC 21268]|nr:TIGR04141 family sporadically distributed protein [Chryseobacterium sp. KACC 21268]
MSEKIQNNLYLLREEVREQNSRKQLITKNVDFDYLNKFLKKKDFKEQKVQEDLSDLYDVKVYYKIIPSDVKWKDFISNVVEADQNILKVNKSSSESYIILFQNKLTNKIYASTGGYAHITIKEIATTDFGIEILARIVKSDDKALKSVKERNLTGGIQGEIKFFRNDYNLYDNDSFGKIYNELNALLTKDILVKSFGFNLKDLNSNSLCIAKDSFSIKKSISFDELLKIIKRCEYLFDNEDPIEINSVNKVAKSEAVLKENLFDTLVTNAYQNYIDSNNFFSIEISNKDFDKYFQATKSKLSFHFRRKPKEIIIDDVFREFQSVIFEILTACGDSLNYEEFKKIINSARLETFDENNITLTYENLSSHFCSEIVYNGQNYFLLEKDWYQIKQSFIDKINDQTSNFLEENKYLGPRLEKWEDTLKIENDYNASYLTKENTFVFDKFTPFNIEACDILKIEGDNIYFYHIKKGFDNSMRDLCNQVYIASRKVLEDVKDDYKYLESLYDSVKNNNGESIYYQNAKTQFEDVSKTQFIKKIRDKKIIFVLAVLDTSNSGRRLDKEIDKFDSNIAKFTLVELSKNMRNLGVDFQILQLEK